jgi:uncharacterized membrane protein
LAGLAAARAAERYDVVGVATDDVLNMRGEVAGAADLSETEIVGRIPAGAHGIAASGITATVKGALWRKVRYGGVDGWVNARFLEPAAEFDPEARPEALTCVGTEPFWSLALGGETAVYETPDRSGAAAERYAVLASVAGRTVRRQWAFHLAPEPSDAAPAATTTRIAVVSRTDRCSDGMSDWTYPYDAMLLDLDPGSGPLQGCCSLMLP